MNALIPILHHIPVKMFLVAAIQSFWVLILGEAPTQSAYLWLLAISGAFTEHLTVLYSLWLYIYGAYRLGLCSFFRHFLLSPATTSSDRSQTSLTALLGESYKGRTNHTIPNSSLEINQTLHGNRCKQGRCQSKLCLFHARTSRIDEKTL